MDFSEKIEERLANIEFKQIEGKEVFNLKEVAAFTGMAPSSIYKKTCTGGIPCYKPFGKCLYFNRVEIVAWLQQHAKPTTEALAIAAANYLSLNHKSGAKRKAAN